MVETKTADAPLTIRHSAMVAAAGEYYVLARLSLLGKIAAQAPRGVPNADIVVSSMDGDRLCAIQVKTRSGIGADGGWHMKEKHEKIQSTKLFYAFVDFGRPDETHPVTYIVPSAIVAEALGTMHAAWLAKPGIKGQKHNDSAMRRFMPDYSRTSGEGVQHYVAGWLDIYREAWALLP